MTAKDDAAKKGNGKMTDKPKDEQPSYTCPRCGMKSYHRIDIKHRYCGNCHKFEDQS